jgi:hypothetical protein
MQNPIEKQNLFVTPESPDDLAEMLDNLPLTRAGIVQAACLAINLCHELVEQENLGVQNG